MELLQKLEKMKGCLEEGRYGWNVGKVWTGMGKVWVGCQYRCKGALWVWYRRVLVRMTCILRRGAGGDQVGMGGIYEVSAHR